MQKMNIFINYYLLKYCLFRNYHFWNQEIDAVRNPEILKS